MITFVAIPGRAALSATEILGLPSSFCSMFVCCDEGRSFRRPVWVAQGCCCRTCCDMVVSDTTLDFCGQKSNLGWPLISRGRPKTASPGLRVALGIRAAHVQIPAGIWPYVPVSYLNRLADRYRKLCRGVARLGAAWRGAAWRGEARRGVALRGPGKARRSAARRGPGAAWQDAARRGKAQPGAAARRSAVRQGKARQGKAR